MTKLEICAIEDANPGVVYLYPEGTFYKAYQQSAWLLCSRVHPFKVSVRPLKGLDGPLLSVGFPLPEKPQPAPFNAPFNRLPVYGAAYRLARELTEMSSRLERNYRYSLGEDIRIGAKKALLCITLAGKGEDRQHNVRAARLAMLDVQLSLRLLNDLKVLPDKRYVPFLEMTEDIMKQLSNWERSEIQRTVAAGVQSPP